MTFKARKNAYSIELASSSRSSCRRCRLPIARGAPRLRITAFIRPGRATSFFRCAVAECLADPRLAAAVVAACGSLERVPRSAQMPSECAVAVRAALSDACGERQGPGQSGYEA